MGADGYVRMIWFIYTKPAAHRRKSPLVGVDAQAAEEVNPFIRATDPAAWASNLRCLLAALPLTAGQSTSGAQAVSDICLGGGTSSNAPRPELLSLAGFAVGDRGLASFGWAGLDGVCGLLADGYHYS